MNAIQEIALGYGYPRETYTTGAGQLCEKVHRRNAICEAGCVIHGPSEHPMRDFPTFWKQTDWKGDGVMTRLCPHGHAHPDPDSLVFMAKISGPLLAGLYRDRECSDCCGCCSGAYSRLEAMVKA